MAPVNGDAAASADESRARPADAQQGSPRSRPTRPHADDAPLVAHGAGRRLRHLLLAGCAALVATGLAWLVLHDWWLAQTPFGPQPHPASAWLLRLHGALAWLVTLVGGAVWQVHVRPAWRAMRRRQSHARRAARALRSVGHTRWRTSSGIASVVGLVVLLVSAIGLQYAPEGTHDMLSLIHWTVGSALVLALGWHWLARLRG